MAEIDILRGKLLGYYHDGGNSTYSFAALAQEMGMRVEGYDNHYLTYNRGELSVDAMFADMRHPDVAELLTSLALVDRLVFMSDPKLLRRIRGLSGVCERLKSQGAREISQPKFSSETFSHALVAIIRTHAA